MGRRGDGGPEAEGGTGGGCPGPSGTAPKEHEKTNSVARHFFGASGGGGGGGGGITHKRPDRGRASVHGEPKFIEGQQPYAQPLRGFHCTAPHRHRTARQLISGARVHPQRRAGRRRLSPKPTAGGGGNIGSRHSTDDGWRLRDGAFWPTRPRAVGRLAGPERRFEGPSSNGWAPGDVTERWGRPRGTAGRRSAGPPGPRGARGR